MHFARIESEYFCGIDLHSHKMYICIIDRQGNICFHKNMQNDFDIFKTFIQPYLPHLTVGLESRAYYYWLADACKQNNISFYLGHAFYKYPGHPLREKPLMGQYCL
jgi:hypothetical protein